MASKETGQPPGRRARRTGQQQMGQAQRWRLAAAGLVVVVALAGLVAWRSLGGEPLDALTASTPPNIIGAAGAPVTVVEFADFGCPACRAWHQAGIRERLLDRFGDQVNFEFRHFPVITQNSPAAAEASQCAAAQGAFWAYHDYIFEASSGDLSRPALQAYATAVGLDRAAFDACLEDGRYAEFVRRQWQQAVDLGARGTPSFFIGRQPVFFSYDGLAAAIEAELN